MRVLRIHHSHDSTHGADYDVCKISRVVREYGEVDDLRCSLKRTERGYEFQRGESNLVKQCASLEELRRLLYYEIKTHAPALIHLHSMPYREITAMILEVGLPVVRSSHEPMLTCPGWARFLSKDNIPCEKCFGPLCFVHAFTKRCQRSRKPQNLYDSYMNVRTELRDFFPSYRRLLVNSNYLAQTLIDHGAKTEQVVVAPSPQFSKAKVESLKDQAKKVPVIFAGRVSKSKGVHLLLEAYRDLDKEELAKCSLEIVGEGGELSALKKLVTEHKIKNVNFHGWVDRDVLAEMFDQDCIAVIPSIYPDHFPNVVAEAMMSSVPVIASDSGGTSEWFKDGVSGLSYPYRSVTGLVERISILLKDSKLRVSMGKSGAEHIRLNHSPEIVGLFYRRLYEEVLAE